ncbi:MULTISPECIES: inositol 2-dehydrogenase [Lacticaseibacillus]|mgnify:FL=1|nr:inositol 2-dehydrogenase [Lacticaseibacillus casei]MBI6598284.1 inositol 2-dehydrogenase [Lacticaseibacillus casei]MBO1481911.1 inositol 2-dehydrogenase [Lacticaseibacillus casei]MBO2417191.1 inositol 2-dehydrogenase [Lacticaseibacillus casei]MCK2081563.1 inositol 2-dehydrogenase [Lacticaseibacillus casei]MDZ5496510.1 inositol 2-dehydrogenase [Lacticaseibacillus casei]
MAQRTVKIGIVGLGRLGKIHATNLATSIQHAKLQAATSVVPEELAWAREELGVEETYEDFDDMVQNADIDAVFIVSPSGFHLPQIESAMNAGKHVFSEKPIGLDLAAIKHTQTVINQHPDLKFQLGFMRRFDDSYVYAKQLVDEGKIGDITLIRSYSIDPASGMESFVKFATSASSGGLFLDMSIHDIDVIRWFTGKEIDKVWAIGLNRAYPVLDQAGELETGAALMQLEDKTMAILVAGRNAAHGYHVETEVIGTKGMLRVAQVPEKNLVTVMNEEGIIRPTSQNFPERFAQAFLSEEKAFVDSILKDTSVGITAEDGLQGTKAALALQQAFEKNDIVKVDDVDKKVGA